MDSERRSLFYGTWVVNKGYLSRNQILVKIQEFPAETYVNNTAAVFLLRQHVELKRTVKIKIKYRAIGDSSAQERCSEEFVYKAHSGKSLFLR